MADLKGNVVRMYPADAAKNPDAVLEQAVGEYEELFIIGWDKQGHLDARATSTLDAANVLWLIEKFKAKLLAGDFSDGGQ